MRLQISEEGHEETVPGQIWYPGCHKWEEDETLPVYINGPWGDPNDIVGRATDIRREEDGKITAEIEWLVDAIPPHYGVTVTIYKVEKHFFGETLFVTSGEIRTLFLTDSCPWAPGWENHLKYGSGGWPREEAKELQTTEAP